MRHLLLPLLVLFVCSVVGCAPSGVILSPEAGPPADAVGEVVAVVDAAPDAAVGDAPAAPDGDAVAVVDAAPDAPRSGALAVTVSAYPGDRWAQVSARCSASGWGTAAGVAATLEVVFRERGVTDTTRTFRATVSPGAAGSMTVEGERVTSGVNARFGQPYGTAAGERINFSAEATLRTLGPVTASVVGCSVVP